MGAGDGKTPDAALETPALVVCSNDEATCPDTAAAAAAMLDKLAVMDKARKAERDRRREESREAADPRESAARFLSNFAARQRRVDDALQRMLAGQAQDDLQQLQHQNQGQAQPQQPASESDPDPDAHPLAPLAVSTATAEQLHASLELLSAEVLSLEQAAAAASYYLPPYDQKQCAASIAALRASIAGARTTLAPRRRFAFGSKKVNKVRGEEVSAAAAATTSTASAGGAVAAAVAGSGATPMAAATGKAAAITPPETSAVGTVRTATGASSSATAADSAAPLSAADAADDAAPVLTVSEQDRALVSRGRGLMGLTDATVVLTAEVVSEGGAGGDFVLLGLTRCRVVLLGRLRALRIAGLRSCTVVSGPVTGACFVDDVRGSSLMLATYQVRVHRTRATDLFLRVRSKPIIEHSTGIRVAPWAAAVAREPRLEQLLQAHMLGDETGCWQQVEDFGWIKSVQSPNWRVMGPDEHPAEPQAVPEAVWESAGSSPGAEAPAGGGRPAGGGDGASAPAPAEDAEI